MLSKAQALQEQMVNWRRHFHAHPELSFREFETSAYLADVLEELGFRVQRNVGRTGVVAELGSGSPVLAIRADMDALPIQEANEVPYCSTVGNVMHACGHDSHMAMLLGAASILCREQLSGTVRLIFQPAEEQEDEDGISGAPRMIEDGAIDGVDCVIALHVDAGVQAGVVQIAPENAAAGVDTFYAKVIGQGGHGSTPHKVIDPIFISGHVILALHEIVSRRLSPFSPAVISIGSINGGMIDNVIPETVSLSGTIRYLSNDVREILHLEIEKAFQITVSMGARYDLRIVPGYPPMENHTSVVNMLNSVAKDLVGNENVSQPIPDMGAEDFGFFMKHAPGAMFFLGCRIDGDERRHHDPRFDIEESCFPVGAAMFAEFALRYFESGL